MLIIIGLVIGVVLYFMVPSEQEYQDERRPTDEG